ncbi:uncharacterized protein [Elaeis guineensis]|uniref:uncharacterized protein n=1 Tax=Elaeis guineensis var. tenera TaxID=51953 RepID=UPI003C6CFD08
MSFNDQQILRFLLDYTGGHELSSFGAIDPVYDPYDWGPHRLPWHGSSGVSYYYTNNANRNNEVRPVQDGSGCWRCFRGKIAIRDGQGSNAVMYKNMFKFIPLGNGGRRNWIMTEYTLHPNMSDGNKGICAIQKEGS